MCLCRLDQDGRGLGEYIHHEEAAIERDSCERAMCNESEREVARVREHATRATSQPTRLGLRYWISTSR